MTIVALLVTATVFGGMVLYSFGFAPFVFTQLEAQAAGLMLRRAFPWYYIFSMVAGAASAFSLIFVDTIGAQIMLAVVLIAMVAHFVLMPRINAARDQGASGKQRFDWLHRTSVALNFVQLALIGWVLARFV
ncbi:MAG: DUF4149 domain-containing protein [Pseudomonadota bacterium]